jgi:hypothetical protein
VTAKQLIAQLVSEFQANPRLRLGILLIIPILLVYFLLVLADYRADLLSEYESQSTNLKKIQALASEKGWAERAQQSQDLRAQAEARLWTSASQGLAKADAQAWLEQLATGLNIEDLRVIANDEVAVIDNMLWVVEMNMQGKFDPQSYTRLLGQIEASPKSATVVLADFTRESLPFFRIRVRLYFQAI